MADKESARMKLQFFAPRWGRADQDVGEFARAVKDAGYHGVEASLPMEPKERDRWVAIFRDHDLLLIAQHWETAAPHFPQYAEEYERRLRNLASAGPVFINSQTGRDFFSREQNLQLVSLAQRVAAQTGIPVYHETHRGKMSFAAHVMARLLEEAPEMAVTLDISHWCCVAETMLGDQQQAVQAALARTRHIHARVGFPEGPQVGDPFAPEWKDVLETHLGWWKQVVEHWRTPAHPFRGNTITTEAGPVPYMPTIPHRNVPVADQWEVNVAMMRYLNEELM